MDEIHDQTQLLLRERRFQTAANSSWHSFLLLQIWLSYHVQHSSNLISIKMRTRLVKVLFVVSKKNERNGYSSFPFFTKNATNLGFDREFIYVLNLTSYTSVGYILGSQGAYTTEKWMHKTWWSWSWTTSDTQSNSTITIHILLG